MADRVENPAPSGAISYLLAALCRAAGLCTIAVAVSVAGTARAAEDPNAGTNSKAARDEAYRAVPFDKMSRESGAAVKAVLDNASLYRRMPRESIDCEPDLYLQCMRNPELIVNMWTSMSITKMTMDKIAPGQYRMADGDGTKGLVQLLYASENTHIVLSEGTYTGPMIARTVRGRCVLIVRSNYGLDNRGRMQITSTLDMFLAIDNLGVELLAKTFSGTVAKASDHNFGETLAFVSKLSKTSENNPDGVIRMARKIPHVEPEVIESFCETVTQVEPKLEMVRRAYVQRTAANEAAAAGRPVPRGLAPATPQMKR
ncbi:MAG: hypothetical protein QM811_04475 [Pirellulales bacterium]